jgi:hypothetical protein
MVKSPLILQRARNENILNAMNPQRNPDPQVHLNVGKGESCRSRLV